MPFFRFLPVIISWVLLGACSSTSDTAHREVDALNDKAYRWRYRDIDSLRLFAQQAGRVAHDMGYQDGEAEALNHLMSERFQQMDFDSALVMAEQLEELTNNQVELLIADIMRMKIAQRTSRNHDFFIHRTRALRRLGRIEEEADLLSQHMQERINYACGEFHIVSATYFYYVDQQERAIEEIIAAEPFCQMQQDTAQWLNYCYMRGSGGMIEEDVEDEEVVHREFDYLFKCFTIAKNNGYLYFEANSLQSFAQLFADSLKLDIVHRYKPDAEDYLKGIFGDENTAQHMAATALATFALYEDRFQTACALRTVGELYFETQDYEASLSCYDQALRIVQGKALHEWEAALHERMSIAYSALGNKVMSDQQRNAYLDLRELTRQDAEWENRYKELQTESRRLWWELAFVLLLGVLLVMLFMMGRKRWRLGAERHTTLLRQAYNAQLEQARQQVRNVAEQQETISENREAAELRIQRQKRQNVEKRAKLQLALSIIPFLDRIIGEVNRMERLQQVPPRTLDYIEELVAQINAYNELLTQWIEMQRGQLSLQITTFDLQPLFDTLRKSHFAYDQKGVELTVSSADFRVKADRSLTLFMLNTLADNARRYTSQGGKVSVTATAGYEAEAPYVELAIEDTGNGMSQEQLDAIMSHEVIQQRTGDDGHQSFGFGLINCRGIIESYKKANPLFRVCYFGAQSAEGKGSRFLFRLPRVMALVMGLLLLVSTPVLGASSPARQEAYRMADSLYYCNVQGRYADAMSFAEDALEAVNRWHSESYPADSSRLSLQIYSLEAHSLRDEAESRWLSSNDSIDFSLILGIRNEAAVAALALGQWNMYRYNNQLYTHLYKLLNQDTSLEAYCMRMEQSQANQRVALVLIVLLLLTAIFATWFFYVRPRVAYRRERLRIHSEQFRHQLLEEEQERLQQEGSLELATDELHRALYEESQLHVQNQIIDNGLSTIKHETMYYPGRISKLLERMRQEDGAELLAPLSETVAYYRELYMQLTAPVIQQSEALNFRRQRVSASRLLSHAQSAFRARQRAWNVEATLLLDTPDPDIVGYGDEELLYLLSEHLIEGALNRWKDVATTPSSPLRYRFSACDAGGFVKYSFTDMQTSLSSDEMHDLFAPHQGGIPYLMCKQIIREHDTFMGHLGCRIVAEPNAEGGHTIWFTIPQYKAL